MKNQPNNNIKWFTETDEEAIDYFNHSISGVYLGEGTTAFATLLK